MYCDTYEAWAHVLPKKVKSGGATFSDANAALGVAHHVRSGGGHSYWSCFPSDLTHVAVWLDLRYLHEFPDLRSCQMSSSSLSSERLLIQQAKLRPEFKEYNISADI